MDKIKGKQFYNTSNDRIGVKFEDGTVDDGLRGQTMDVNINGKWIPTRIEMSNDWFLVGIKGIESLTGLLVRL